MESETLNFILFQEKELIVFLPNSQNNKIHWLPKYTEIEFCRNILDKSAITTIFINLKSQQSHQLHFLSPFVPSSQRTDPKGHFHTKNIKVTFSDFQMKQHLISFFIYIVLHEYSVVLCRLICTYRVFLFSFSSAFLYNPKY